jgi:hypothetical protein
MITKQDLEDMGALSPLLKDFLMTTITEGVDQMADVLDLGKVDYDHFFNDLKDSEAKQMFEFLNEVALPLFDDSEMYELSSKVKNMSDLLTKYKGLKKN